MIWSKLIETLDILVRHVLSVYIYKSACISLSLVNLYKFIVQAAQYCISKQFLIRN